MDDSDEDLTFAEQARLARLVDFDRRRAEREAWLAAAEAGEWPVAGVPEAWQVESHARWMERDLWRKLTS